MSATNVNVESMTFGVEIETTIPRGTLSVGPHGHGYAIEQLAGWKADGDPSIRATGNHVACEFVSPVFTGSAGLKQCLADVAKIVEMGAKVNQSCGLHIHVGFDKANAEQMAKLVTLVANFEKAVYASTGTKKREQGRWCNRVSTYGSAENAVERARHNRYHVLNVATGSKPTVEFRAFGATLNTTKLAAYVMMVLGLVERALRASKATNWTAKTPAATSPIHRDGEGLTAITRLFYQLGWTKGRQKHVHGELKGDGIPALKKAKKELTRLAKKYDEAGRPAPRRDGLAVGVEVSLNAIGHYLNAERGRVVEIRRGRYPIVIEIAGRGRRIRATAAQVTIIPPAPPATN